MARASVDLDAEAPYGAAAAMPVTALSRADARRANASFAASPYSASIRSSFWSSVSASPISGGCFTAARLKAVLPELPEGAEPILARFPVRFGYLSGVTEQVGAFLRSEVIEEFAETIPDGVEGALRSFAKPSQLHCAPRGCRAVSQPERTKAGDQRLRKRPPLGSLQASPRAYPGSSTHLRFRHHQRFAFVRLSGAARTSRLNSTRQN
jgi:hypothetical protein